MNWFCRLFGYRYTILEVNKGQFFPNCPRCGKLGPGIYRTELTAKETNAEVLVLGPNEETSAEVVLDPNEE